jgi:hypothetical protein
MSIRKNKSAFWFRNLFAWIMAALLFATQPLSASEPPEFLDQEYVSLSLQGNLSDIEKILTAREQTPNAIELLERFRARFVARTDGLDLENEDPLVRAVGGRYQEYWRDALLDPGQREALEDGLARDVIKILQKNGVSSWNISADNYQDFLSRALEKRGYYGIFGRTIPLLEFMVWKENGQTTTPVELTDGFQEVEVNYLRDFVSLGWASFATFGGPSTGGWATDEGLFVVTEKWDLESESFKVSFLKHEARHFADYGLYPELEGADLEYRAKLTEISFSVESMYGLLKMFTSHAARTPNAPHPLANWHVITDLSRELLDAEWPDDPKVWSGVSIGDLQAAARKLLLEHDRGLVKAGAKKTTGIITP